MKEKRLSVYRHALATFDSYRGDGLCFYIDRACRDLYGFDLPCACNRTFWVEFWAYEPFTHRVFWWREGRVNIRRRVLDRLARGKGPNVFYKLGLV